MSQPPTPPVTYVRSGRVAPAIAAATVALVVGLAVGGAVGHQAFPRSTPSPSLVLQQVAGPTRYLTPTSCRDTISAADQAFDELILGARDRRLGDEAAANEAFAAGALEYASSYVNLRGKCLAANP